MRKVKAIEGQFSKPKGKIAIIASRFNGFVVESLIEGAFDGLTRHGMNENDIELIQAPGAYEIPLVCKKLAETGRFQGMIALGAVIRGSTAHFDYVAQGCAGGLSQVSLETGVPIAFGVLTTDTIEQAIERSGTKAGNKGFDAALSCLEMIDLIEKING